jgi:hypothetical protein
MPEKKYAWHFLTDLGGGKYGLLDERPRPATGRWLRHEGKIQICARGLHASYRAWDALHYAPSNYVTRVEVRGDVYEQSDKLVCRERKIVWGYDAEHVLRKFSRDQALSCLHEWDAPQVVRQWLETGDESLRSAARSAAESAAESAARSAAESAAWSAARSAAWSAARSAARSAALDKANTLLEDMLFAEAERLGFKGGR